MKRKKHSSFLGKVINFIFTIILVIITACVIQTYTNSANASSVLKFAQISDSHLSMDKINKSYRLTAHSTELLSDATDIINHKKNINFVFFTGDLIDVPYEKNLRVFFNYANKLKFPYYTVPGNHDICVGGYLNKELFVKMMNENNKNYTFSKTYYSFVPKAGYKVIALDPIIDTRITANGELPQEQLDFLDKEISKAKDCVILIFMHVPLKQPFSSDSHRLLNASQVYDILKKYNNPIGIFTGHYHTTRVIQEDNIIHVSTPALISYPNAFRFVTIHNYKNKTIFDIQYVPTRLLELQKKSKLLVFHSSTYFGDEQDRTTTITVNKRK